MSDTGPAKLPGLPALKNSDPALQRWAQAVAEHLEVRAGARGNPAERGVTQRELLAATNGLDYLRSEKTTTASAGDVVLNLGGGLTVKVAIDAFAKSIFDSPLYKSLMKRVDDKNRFDDVPEEVRKLLLIDIAKEAAQRGADIVRLEKAIQTNTSSLAYSISEVTAAIQGVSAGVRETTYASANANLATAGKVTQVQARLDGFNGGAATIEETFSTVASGVTGLSAEYMVKVDAGGIFGGFGLSAHMPADPNKPGYSSFLVAADKFAVVFPGNVGGPDAKRVPFGIDANGIYMHSDVYVKGTMRVDGGGKMLIDGLRGSLNVGISQEGWSDTLARDTIFTKLGGTPPALDNNHLVIGDSVTFTDPATKVGVTKYWNGSAWAVPGVVVSGDMIIDGGLAASKIDTRGLTIKDANGNVILGSGVGLSASYFNNLTYALVGGTKPPSNADNTASNTAAGIAGQGALATANDVRIGSTVKFADGSTMGTADFVNKLAKIGTGNISTFIDGLAVTNAYIGNAAVNTLKIAGNSVTVPVGFSNSAANVAMASGGTHTVSAGTNLVLPDTASVMLMCSYAAANNTGTGSSMDCHVYLNSFLSGYNSYGAFTVKAFEQGHGVSMIMLTNVPIGTHSVNVRFTNSGGSALTLVRFAVLVMGAAR